MINFYTFLKLPMSSSIDEIKKRKNALLKKWHPDKNPNNPLAEDMTKRINEAYEILSDPEKRRKLDSFIVSEKQKENEMKKAEQKKNQESNVDLWDILKPIGVALFVLAAFIVSIVLINRLVKDNKS
jgi:curved DNA-binding protein